MKAFPGRLARVLAEAALLLALVAGGAGILVKHEVSAPGPLRAARTVVIKEHLGLAGIAALLAKAGVIRHPLSFELAAFFSGRRRQLKAGEYAFPARTSPLEAIAIIVAGKVVEHPLTVPDGLTSPEVVALLRAAPDLKGRIGKIPKEGELFPETYFYTYGETRGALIGRMRAAMTRALSAVWAARPPGYPLASPRQLLILASVIEKESKIPGEERHIAAVFLNRLRLGMPLQSDPTVIYALSEGGQKKFDPPLTSADLKVRSPYNTYLVKGLPPGPIDNPGRAALLAAAHPATSEDLYFVANGKGGHVFSKTLSQHDRNVRAYRRIEFTKALFDADRDPRDYRRIEATLAAKAMLLEAASRAKKAAGTPRSARPRRTSRLGHR